MRGSCHLTLRVYYAILTIVALYGDEISRTSSPPEALRVLASVLRPELLVAVAVFIDIARAPDCDIACRGTVLGYVPYVPLKPFLRTHRGWYHSPWAALYVSAVVAVLLAAAALLVNSAATLLGFDVSLSPYSVATAAFSAALLSYLLHLVEDGATVRGIRWLGVMVRGPLRTGETDVPVVVSIVLTSAALTVLTYLATSSPSSAALAGILSVAASFALMVRIRRSS